MSPEQYLQRERRKLLLQYLPKIVGNCSLMLIRVLLSHALKHPEWVDKHNTAAERYQYRVRFLLSELDYHLWKLAHPGADYKSR